MVGDDHTALAGRGLLLAIECRARTCSPVALSHLPALACASLFHSDVSPIRRAPARPDAGGKPSTRGRPRPHLARLGMLHRAGILQASFARKSGGSSLVASHRPNDFTNSTPT